jgi:hypothetical protein
MTGPFTAVFAQGDGKIIASIEELPATYAEGATIEDARAALIVELVRTLATNRHETHRCFAGSRVAHREVLTVRAARDGCLLRQPPELHVCMRLQEEPALEHRDAAARAVPRLRLPRVHSGTDVRLRPREESA